MPSNKLIMYNVTCEVGLTSNYCTWTFARQHLIGSLSTEVELNFGALELNFAEVELNFAYLKLNFGKAEFIREHRNDRVLEIIKYQDINGTKHATNDKNLKMENW